MEDLRSSIIETGRVQQARSTHVSQVFLSSFCSRQHSRRHLTTFAHPSKHFSLLEIILERGDKMTTKIEKDCAKTYSHTTWFCRRSPSLKLWLPGLLRGLVHSQHYIRAFNWQKFSEEEVFGHHQLRTAHQQDKGHGIKHCYRKFIEGGRARADSALKWISTRENLHFGVEGKSLKPVLNLN